MRLKGKEFLFVFFVFFFMIVGGMICGFEEEVVVFYLILVLVFIVMGYDVFVVVGLIFFVGLIGICFLIINLFFFVIGVNVVGIWFIEGMIWCVIGFVGGVIVVVFYLVWYLKKVKVNFGFFYVWED